MSEKKTETIRAIEWAGDHLRILDQTHLPEHEVILEIHEAGHIWEAIRSLKVRGAPAIGIAAAYGLYLGLRDHPETSFEVFDRKHKQISAYLASARPTAVNLQWALDRAEKTIYACREQPIAELKKQLLQLAQTIHEEDKRTCTDIGRNGQPLIPSKAGILTHCNTGSLATGGTGTAHSIICHAHHNGKKIHVWVDETRPLLQGSRLTAWELKRANIDYHIITDSMAGWVMKNNKVDLVVTGADRIAGNGDTANKIGTYGLAILSAHHNIPFYVAAPLSTVDMTIANGDHIPVEEREGDELRKTGMQWTSPKDAPVYNPAFDITPHQLITAFVTEAGIIKPDFSANFKKLYPLKIPASSLDR